MDVKKLILWISGLVILTIAVVALGLEEITASVRQVKPETLVLLLVLQILTLLSLALQWQFLLKKLKQNLSFALVFAITLAGNYVESVTPAVKLGGEAAKIYLFRQHSSLDYDLLAGILLALKYYSMLPFVCLVVVFTGSAFINFNLPHLVLSAFAFLLLFFAAIALVYFKAGTKPILGSVRPVPDRLIPLPGSNISMGILREGLVSLKKRLVKIIMFVNRAAMYSRSMANCLERLALITLSTLVWLAYPVKVLLVARMLNLEIGIIPIAVITFTAYLISIVPLLPGGLGSYEASMTLMFSIYGFSLAEGLSVALLTRLVTYWFPLLLSALAVILLALAKPTGIIFPGESDRVIGFSGGVESSS